MPSLRTLLLLASLATAVLPPLAAQTPAPAAAVQPATAREVAYWIQLQKELSELRSANAADGVTAGLLSLDATKISGIATRLEGFLDRRDRDPVGELGPEFLAYRETLLKLMEFALAPVTGAAAFKSKGIASGEERMYAVMTNFQQVGQIDAYKPRLALQHAMLVPRVVAAGGPTILFIQTLGLGDKPSAPGTLALPEERDAQFLAASTAINPILGEITPVMFVQSREKMGVTGEAMMTEMLKTFSNFRERIADASTEELAQALEQRSPLNEDGSFSLPQRLLRLELLRRTDQVTYNIAMQEWQGAFARWIGKASEVAPTGPSTDVAVALDGSWFAYSPSETTLAIHDAATGALRETVELPEPIRAFATTHRNDILLFTALGGYVVDLTFSPAKAFFKAERKSTFVTPHVAASPAIDRQVFALGVMPAVIGNGGDESTFSTPEATSTVTAVAISADGRRFAYGHGGDNVTGSGNPRYGVDVFEFEPGPIAVAEGGEIKANTDVPRLRFAATAIALGRTGERVAATWVGTLGSNVTITKFNDKESDQTVLSFDHQPYSWVSLLEDGDLRVIAGTRDGIVRIWNASSRELIQRFEVPAGPAGVGYALVGGDLVTVAIGSVGIHRWKIADGSLVATFLGEAPSRDTALLKIRLEAEQALAPTRDLLVALFNYDNEDVASDLKIIEQLRASHGSQLAALGQQRAVDSQIAYIRIEQINKLVDDNRDREGFEVGMVEISAGVLSENLFLSTVRAGSNAVSAKPDDAAFRQRVLGLAERAAGLYPSNVLLQVEYVDAKIYQLSSVGKFSDALKLIDELDLIEPSRAPHSSTRKFINHDAAYAAHSAGNLSAAIGYYTAALQSTSNDDKKGQLEFGELIFSLGCQIKDWKSALYGANVILTLNPGKQSDESFMYWAREAYKHAGGGK